MLAFACGFTMFAGAASFTDEADISENNRDAVELLTTLGIIKGYEDGSFDPEGTVDRAEMAKMIYTIRNGGNDDASAHVGNTTSFTDISGHWAEGYIKYLQNTGIVAGKSATQFAPDAQVTTAEAMKMALALAGYDEVNAGLTGIDWQKNTLTYATTIGLTDDVNSAMSAGCSRQDAAQILANVLEANAVRYSSIVENFVNDSKTGLSYGGDPITVGNKWMDLTIYVGQMVSSGELNINGVADAGKDRFVVDVDTVDGVNVSDVRNWYDNFWYVRDNLISCKDGEDHTDLVGMEVKVLVGDKEDEVYGVYATSTSNVVETTMDKVDVENDLDLTVDEVTYDAKDAAVYVDLDADAKDVATVFTTNGQAVADTVKMIDWDDDGDYETILVNTVSVSKVNYVSSSSITLSAVGASNMDRNIGNKLDNSEVLDFDDNTIAEDIAKGDFAVVTINDYDDSWNVEVATVVEGTVNGIVKNERKVRVDGTWYTLANSKADVDPKDNMYDLYTAQGSRDDFVNKDEVTLYVVGEIAYYAEATKGNDVNRSVLMVYDVQDTTDSWGSRDQAKVIFPNGDKETVTINNDGVDLGDLKPGQMYYYTTNNDDEYILTVLGNGANQEDAGYENVEADKNGIDDNNRFGGRTIADEAIVFALVGGDDAEVYTGKAIKDAKLTGTATKVAHGQLGQALQETDNGFTYTRMMNIDIADNTIDTTTAYGYLVTDGTYSYNSELGQYVMEYSFWNGEEVVDAIELTSSNKERWATKHTIIAYAEDGDYIKDVKVADGLTYAALVGYSNGQVSLDKENGGNQVADVDADTITFYVDSNATNSSKIGQQGDGWDYVAPIRNGKHLINVAYVMDNDGEDVKFIVIDVDGQLEGHDTTTTTPEPPTTSEEATVSNIRVNNNGTMRATLTIDRANTWIADTGVVTVPWIAYDADGNYMDEGTATFTAGVTTQTISSSGFDANQTGVTIALGDVTSTVVDVRFFNGTTELTVGDNTKQVTTTTATVGTTTGAQLTATANWLAGKVSAAANYEIKGATGTTLTGNVTSLTNASGVAQPANIGGNDTKALGTGYVDVVFSNVTDSGSKYSFSVNTDANAKTLADYNITTTDKASTLTFAWDKASASSTDIVKLTATINTIGAGSWYQVDVNLPGVGSKSVTIDTQAQAETVATFQPTQSIDLTKAMVTVTEIPSVQITKAEVVAQDSTAKTSTIKLTFNQKLDTTVALATGNFTLGGTPAPAFDNAIYGEDGMSIILTTKTNALAADTTLVVASLKGENEQTVSTSLANKVTFKADTDGSTIIVDQITKSV